MIKNFSCDANARHDRMIFARAGEFTKPGAKATVYERFLGVLMHGTDEDVQRIRDLIQAHDESGSAFEELLTQEQSWSAH